MMVLNFDSYFISKILDSFNVCLSSVGISRGKLCQLLVVCKAAAEKRLTTEDFSSREGLRHFETPCFDSFQLIFGHQEIYKEI